MTASGDRPALTAAALGRWLPSLVRRTPDLVSAYALPGRVSPRLREATMLGVTSVNRCRACAQVHERWGRAVGLEVDDPGLLAPAEAAAFRYGRMLAECGPRGATPPEGLSRRHRRELEAAGVLMELANLGGNTFLAGPAGSRGPMIGDARMAGLYDAAMRVADGVGIRMARRRTVAGATGDVLEIGIGTGLNLADYPPGVSLAAIDVSEAALAVAARRASRLRRPVALAAGDAARLPFADASFDALVGTFVLCSVADVAATLAEGRRVLRPGGTARFLEHGRSSHRRVARLQERLAPAWWRISGGCRLDHDVRAAIESAGFRITGERSRGRGLLVEVVAVSS